MVRLTSGAGLVLFALLVTSRAIAAGDWPENYIVHEHSKSPDGRYGVLVFSQQAAIDQNQTDGNTTYLANLQTRKTLGQIRGTDYFENENHRDLQVIVAASPADVPENFTGSVFSSEQEKIMNDVYQAVRAVTRAALVILIRLHLRAVLL